MNATTEKTVLTDEQRAKADKAMATFEMIPAECKDKALYFLEGMAAAASAITQPKVTA